MSQLMHMKRACYGDNVENLDIAATTRVDASWLCEGGWLSDGGYQYPDEGLGIVTLLVEGSISHLGMLLMQRKNQPSRVTQQGRHGGKQQRHNDSDIRWQTNRQRGQLRRRGDVERKQDED